MQAPLYSQLEEDLRARIGTGEFKPGDILPSEQEIGREYKVSRITVRRAIENLCREFLLIRRHGVGTFVAEAKQVLQSIRFRGRLDDVLALDNHLDFAPLTVGSARMPATVAQAFRGKRREAPWAEVVALLDGKPFMFGDCWFDPERVGTLRSDDFRGSEQPTLKILRAARIQIARGEQTVHAALPPPRVVEHLGLERSSPLVQVIRAYMDEDDDVAAVILGYYHPTNYRMTVELLPEGNLPPRRLRAP